MRQVLRASAPIFSTMIVTAILCGTPAWAQSSGSPATPVTASGKPADADNPSAATAPAAASNGTLGDIVVTARRREERLQDVPVSVSVQTGTQLAARGIATVADLGRLAPSLTVSPSPRGGNTPSFVIRGQRLIDFAPTLDPVVVLYFNEVPFMRPNGLNAALFDIQNVQVLRGPQGTLFGRNSTGGAVLISTNLPDTSAVKGRVAATYGNYDHYGLEGMINLPLGEGIALRVAGVRSKRDGYMRNRDTGFRQSNENYDAERLTLLLEPTDGIRSVTYANRFHSSDNGAASQIYAYGPAASSRPFEAALRAEIAKNQAQKFTFGADINGLERTRTWDVSNVTTIELADTLKFKNIIGYRRIKAQSIYDLDASNVFIQRQVAGNASNRQFSEEAQIQGEGANYDFVGGLFYLRESGSDIGQSRLGSSPSVLRVSGLYYLNRSLSGFASGNYRFPGIEGLSISAGVRYTHDERRVDGLQRVGGACAFRLNSGQLLGEPCLYRSSAKFNEPSWSASLNYKVDQNLLLYVAHRHGYRAGGLQSRATTEQATVPFNPEKVNDIELGSKFDFTLGDVRGRLNADVFYAKYKSIQKLSSFVGANGTLVSAILNAASSTVKGFETELTLAPARNLELAGSVGYVDPKYKSFLNGGVDISNTPFGYVAKWTINAQATWTLPVPESTGEIVANVNYRYQSGFYDSDVPQPFSFVQGYSLTNARIDWNKIGGTGIGASVYVNNIFNKAYYPYGTNLINSLGFASRFVGPPRLYGVQLRYAF